MPNEQIDLILTSPPYDNMRNYLGGIKWDFEEFAKIAPELYRVLKVGGVLVWVVGDATQKGSETLTSFKQALYFKEQCGFNVHDTMIYHKKGLPMNHRRYEQEFEYMFVCSKGKPKTFNGLREKCKHFGRLKKVFASSASSQDARANSSKARSEPIAIKETKLRGNVWTYAVGAGQSSRDKVAFDHPAIFPEALALDHILTWTNAGDLVFDPFAGSGTTAKIAHLNGRLFVCSEVSEHYCSVARQRLAPYVPTDLVNFTCF